MHARIGLPESIRHLAAQRHGVVSRLELLEAGLSRNVIVRLIRDWETPARGVYLLPGKYDEWFQKVYTGIVLAGPGAAASGTTALAIWGLGDRPATIEVITSERHTAYAPWLQLRRDDGQLRRIVRLDPPRVSLEDAGVDSAAAASRHEALAAVSRALQERRTTPARLLATARTRTRLRHRALLINAIGDTARGAHSALEHLYLRDVQRAHGLPPMQLQYCVPETGHTSDGAYVAEGVLIELDGVRYHDAKADQALDNLHGTFGHRTFRFEWHDIHGGPCEVARTVAAAVGFTTFTRCPRCPSDISAPNCAA